MTPSPGSVLEMLGPLGPLWHTPGFLLILAARAPIRYPTGCCTFHYPSHLEGPPSQRGGHTGEVRCKTGAVPQL